MGQAADLDKSLRGSCSIGVWFWRWTFPHSHRSFTLHGVSPLSTVYDESDWKQTWSSLSLWFDEVATTFVIPTRFRAVNDSAVSLLQFWANQVAKLLFALNSANVTSIKRITELYDVCYGSFAFPAQMTTIVQSSFSVAEFQRFTSFVDSFPRR